MSEVQLYQAKIRIKKQNGQTLLDQECIDPLDKLTNQLAKWINKVNLTYNKRGSTNKSPTKLNAAENKFDTGDLFMNEENHRGKISPVEFKVNTSKNPLLLK